MKRSIIWVIVVFVVLILGWNFYNYFNGQQYDNYDLGKYASNTSSQKKDGQLQEKGIEYSKAMAAKKDKKVKGKRKRAKGEKEVPVKKEDVIPVKAQQIEGQLFTAKLKVVGTTKAADDFVLSAKLNGEVTEINAEIGQYVQKGEVLGRIDPEMAEAQRKQAEANYNLALSTYKRQKNLAKKKLISTQQLESVKTQYQVAQASYKLAKINLKNSKIVCPINGIIAERYVELHQFLGIGTPVIRVVNIDNVEMQLGVSEKNIVQVKPGIKSFLKLSSYPGEVFPGLVTQVGMQANQDNKTFPIKVEFPNKERKIKGGMIGDVTILLNTYKDSVVVPFYLLQKTGDSGYYIYTEQDGIAVRNDVVIGEIQDDQVRIVSGLKIGEKIIVEGYKYVSEGSKIQIQ